MVTTGKHDPPKGTELACIDAVILKALTCKLIPKVQREDRLCSLCGVTVENEYHFLLECPVLSLYREKLFFIVSKVMPDFKTLPAHVQLFTVLAHPNVINSIPTIAKAHNYLYGGLILGVNTL